MSGYNENDYDQRPTYNDMAGENDFSDDQPQYDNQYYDDDQEPTPNRTLKGYKILIIVLAAILLALTALYFMQTNNMRKEFAVERDTLNNRMSSMLIEYDNLQIHNDTIAHTLAVERERVDSLRESLKKERNYSRAKIRQYEKEVGTLRDIMKGYVNHIDSLNQLNAVLIRENVDYRTQIATARVAAEEAQERADELSIKVRKGAVVQARNIGLVMLTNSDKEATRASRAERIRVDFDLSSNDLTEPGARAIYLRLTGPDGYILASSAESLFDYEGSILSYSAMREVEYQNADIGVSIFYNGGGITEGEYMVDLYMDGHHIGNSNVILR